MMKSPNEIQELVVRVLKHLSQESRSIGITEDERADVCFRNHDLSGGDTRLALRHLKGDGLIDITKMGV